jgi:hypothetical protein
VTTGPNVRSTENRCAAHRREARFLGVGLVEEVAKAGDEMVEALLHGTQLLYLGRLAGRLRPIRSRASTIFRSEGRRSLSLGRLLAGKPGWDWLLG